MYGVLVILTPVVVGCGRIDFDGDAPTPRSCRDLERSGRPTGIATLDRDGEGPRPARDVWCEQDRRGGGWTLALKIDGSQSTFLGSSQRWEDTTLLNADSLDPATGDEAKLVPFLDEPLAEVLLVIDGSETVAMRARGPSLFVMMTSRFMFPASTPDLEWQLAFPPGLLQPGCRRQGVALTNQPAPGVIRSLRIGVVASNDPGECDAVDSFIGVGPVFECPIPIAAGNGHLGMGFCQPRRVDVYVRDDDETHFASESSCAKHLSRGRTDDGLYLVGGEPHRCDMTTDGGGWTSAFDFDNLRDPCPGDWMPDPTNPRVCIVPTGQEVSSVFVPSPIGAYQEVRTRVIGYQRGSTDGFENSMAAGIDGAYTDGLSLTVGSPRQHIATFAVGYSDVNRCVGSRPGSCLCPCSGGPQPPSFVSNAWRCESGTPGYPMSLVLSFPDPVFDGSEQPPACAVEGSGVPVHSLLPAPTTDDLEVRLIRDEPQEGESLGVTQLVIWVR